MFLSKQFQGKPIAEADVSATDTDISNHSTEAFESDSDNSVDNKKKPSDDSNGKSSVDDKESLDHVFECNEGPPDANSVVAASKIDKTSVDIAGSADNAEELKDGTKSSNQALSAEEDNENSVISDSQIPTVTNNTETNANGSVEVYYQEVDRIDNFSAADSTLLDKYGSCIPNIGAISTCNTNPLYQPYQCQPSYSYQQDAQVYSHYDQLAQYNQQPNAALTDQQNAQENENTVGQNEQRSYTSLSSESHNDSKQSSIKTEPDNSSPVPPISGTSWPPYIPIPNMDMADYNQYHPYSDYNKPEHRSYSESVLNVPAKPMCDPMLAGSEMDDLASLESQSYHIATSNPSVYSTAVKLERDSLTRPSPYVEQYQRTAVNTSEPEAKPKKSVRVPAGKL